MVKGVLQWSLEDKKRFVENQLSPDCFWLRSQQRLLLEEGKSLWRKDPFSPPQLVTAQIL